MSNPFILWGVGLGVLLAVVYFCFRLSQGRNRSIEDVMSVFSYVIGVLGGIQVCWVAYIERATAPIDRISRQMFAGGFALALFAVNKILKKFQED